MAKLNLSAPWHIYYQQVKALFEDDPEIRVIYDEEAPELKILVAKDEKAEAISKILPTEKRFGDIVLPIIVIPGNSGAAVNGERFGLYGEKLFQAAFDGNPAFRFTSVFYGLFNNPIIYVAFAKKVVQYYTDDLGDYYGFESTVYEELARQVFNEVPCVYFCTDRD